jgi:hypothetical protein
MPAVSARAPLLVVAAAIVVVNFALIAARLVSPMPTNPWEAGLVVDGWRMSRGMTVYEDPRSGHATTMYGPLDTAAHAAVFKLTGPNNYAGRVFETLCGLAAVTLRACALLRGQPRTTLFVGWAILLGINARSGDYFPDARPDMACLLFSVLAVLLAYRDGWKAFAASLAALVVAFYFKQTAVVAAVAISLAYLLRRGRSRRWLLKALASFAVLPCAALLTRVFSPVVFHYMIVVPSLNLIPFSKVVSTTLLFLPTLPIFYVALAEFLSGGCPLGEDGRFLLAALPFAFVYSVVSTARLGGIYNSLVPALTVMLAFAVWRLPQLLSPLDSAQLTKARRHALGAALALAVFASAFAALDDAYFHATAKHGDEHYAGVIALARTLPGKVVCPDDPTIPLYAKGYAGRLSYMERDAVATPEFVPDYALDEVESADYVIQINKPSYPSQPLPDSRLEQLGFRPVEYPELEGTAYTVWAAKR